MSPPASERRRRRRAPAACGKLALAEPLPLRQSFCGWPYARVGGPVKSEDDPLDPAPRRGQRETFAAIRHVGTTMSNLRNLKGAALRYGVFYGPDTGLFEPDMVRQLKRRAVPLIGDGGGWWSLIHIDDAASATVAAIEGDAAGVFNVVDDEPAPVRRMASRPGGGGGREASAKASRLDRPSAGGRCARRHDDAGAGGVQREDQARVLLGPGYPSWRQGFREVGVAADAPREARRTGGAEDGPIDSHGRRRSQVSA